MVQENGKQHEIFRSELVMQEIDDRLLPERIRLQISNFIDYLEDVKVFDEKTQKDSVFYKQRRRWLASQFDMLKSVLRASRSYQFLIVVNPFAAQVIFP